MTRTSLIKSFGARLARCEARPGKLARNQQVYPPRHTNCFFTGLDDAAVCMSSIEAKDSYQSSPNKWSSEQGFSIVELLVVSAIFGILALIAVPQYSMYRERSYKTAAANDLRNVALAQENFFAKNAKYLPLSNCLKIDPLSHCTIDGLPGVARLSKGVNMKIETSPAGFRGEARHASSNLTCRWDSTQGGMLGCSK